MIFLNLSIYIPVNQFFLGLEFGGSVLMILLSVNDVASYLRPISRI